MANSGSATLPLNAGSLIAGTMQYGSGELIVTGSTAANSVFYTLVSTGGVEQMSSSFSGSTTSASPSVFQWSNHAANTLNSAIYNQFTGAAFSSVISSAQPTYAERMLSWKDKLVQEIGQYGSRPSGWDGYNAQPIREQAIVDAQEFVHLLPDDTEPPRDMPCSDGEISLVWRDGNRFAEISFPGNGTFYWYATDAQNHGFEDDVPVTHGFPARLQEILGIGLTKTSIPPFPQYGRILLEAA
jgi:hypothetical protein